MKLFINNNKIFLILKNASIYAIGNFFSKFINYLIVPIYTINIDTYNLGKIESSINLINLLLPIASFQILESAFRFIIDKNNNEKLIITNLISLLFKIIILNVIIIAIYIIIFNYSKYSIIISLSIIIQINYQVFQQINRGLNKNKIYMISGVITTIIQSIFIILLLLIIKTGPESILYGNIIGYFFGLLYLIINSNLKLYFDINLIDIKYQFKLIKYSLPFIPNALSWWFFNGFGLTYITLYLKLFSLGGILGVANKFPSILVLINSMFMLSWQESAIKEFYSIERNIFYEKIFKYFIKIQLLVLLLLLPIVKIYFNKFIGFQYQEAFFLTPFLFFSAIFSSLASFTGTLYIVFKKPIYTLKITIITVIFSIIINILLINKFNIIGSSISTMLSFFILFILRLYDVRKIFKINLFVFDKKILIYLILNIINIYLINKISIYLVLYIIIIIGIIILFNIKNIKNIKNIFKKE